MKYTIEKHTTVEYIVCIVKDKLRMPIAKCNSEGIALTIKGMYEKDDLPSDIDPDYEAMRADLIPESPK